MNLKSVKDILNVQKGMDEEPMTDENVVDFVVSSFEKKFNTNGVSLVEDNKKFIDEQDIAGFDSYSAKKLNELAIFESTLGGSGYTITEYNPIDNDFEIIEDTALSQDQDMYAMFIEASEAIESKNVEKSVGLDR